MFEQDLNTPEPVVSANAEPQPETDELFGNYELKSWEFSPRIYKIIAGSAIFNILVFAVFTQTGLLTMKGCNSPFVGRVCQVLDTVYLGAMLYSTERDFVDMEYERIDLSQSEITFLDVSGEAPQLTYPAGYFQIANPESEMDDMLARADIPLGMGNNPAPRNDLFRSKPNLPKPNPRAVTGKDPVSPFEIEDDDEDVKPKNGKQPASENANTNTPKPDDAVAQNNTNTAVPTEDVIDPNSIVINRRPLTELGERVIGLRENGQVDLKSKFTIIAYGKIDKSGKLDPKTFRYQIDDANTDNEMIGRLVVDSLETINDSGFLGYLATLNGEDLKLTLVQDEENISAVIETQTNSEADARSKSSGLSGLLSLVKLTKRNADSQNAKDDMMLLNGIKVENTGRTIKINFNIEKDLIHPMLERKLAEQAAEMKKPSGNAMHNQNNRLAMVK